MIALLALVALALSTLSPADPAIPPALLARLAGTDVVILGELHDNPTHHRLQAAILRGLVAQGRRPALAMEQLDREHQAALDAALAAPGATPESVAEAGRFDRQGWDWPAYRPLLEIALAHQLPLVAANFSRADARTLVAAARAGKPATPTLGDPNIEQVLARADTPARRAAIEAEIERSHCGHRFEAPMLGGMVRAQQARDAVMAHLTAQAAQVTHAGNRRGAVLITGRGHARTDHGVPAYLPAQLGVFALGFLETRPGETPPVGPEPATAGQPYDLVWRTAPAEREDPCIAFRAARPQAKPQ